MSGLIIDNEPMVRLIIFFSAFFMIAVTEWWLPRRDYRISRITRWVNNLGISIVNTLVIRFLVPISATALAVLLAENNWGLLRLVDIPLGLSVFLFVVIFDLSIYFQHRLFHYVDFFWRFHRVHHTDLDYDITTGNRFHPVSILFSMMIKLILVFILGGPPLAIIISEVLLNFTSMFNHSNIKIPHKIDKYLRLMVVTPDMHRIHHSADLEEHQRNFAFNFPWWDRLFGTYQDQPKEGHEEMQIGLPDFDESTSVYINRLLLQPFGR